jgi:hypothetical protein
MPGKRSAVQLNDKGRGCIGKYFIEREGGNRIYRKAARNCFGKQYTINRARQES